MSYSIVSHEPPNASWRAVALSKVARMTMLNTPDDVAWVRDIHLPKLPHDVGCVVLVGNEDCPDGFMAYQAREPLLDDAPVVYARDAEEPEECAACHSFAPMTRRPVSVDGADRFAWICDACGHAHVEPS